MGFRTGSYASIWSVEEQGKVVRARISTSRKNKDTGAYEQDFSGFVTFVGTARAKAAKLREKDRIVLGDIDVTTKYDKERGKEYVNYTVFDFESADGASPQGGRRGSAVQKPSAMPVSNDEEGESDEENLPF